VSFSGITNWQIDADTIPELRAKFGKKVGDICYKRGAKAFVGTVSVEKREWTSVAEDKDFSGTFATSETIVIDFGA